MSEKHPWIDSAPPEEQPGQGANGQRPDSGTVRDAVGQVLAGRFEVHEEIGSGAFAVTYRGRDRRLGRSVAIKVLRQTYATSPGFVQSVEREARAAALVTHGNVVDVYDFGQHGELLYMVMQYIEGEDLKHLIVRDGPLPERRAVEITLQMLAGLAAVHQAGIIHRDIKPQNVMIGRDGIARVTDFGIARVTVDVGLTTTGTTDGTASYMAPEQAQAGPLAEATDLYSVGVVLYEMLTGRLPFEAPTTIALMLAHIQSRPVSPSARAPGQRISPEVDAVVMRALAKRPEDRFVNAPAMAWALTAAIGDVPAVTEATRPVMAIAPDTVRTGVPTSARRGNAPAAVPVMAEPRSRARLGLWVLPLLLLLLLAGGMGGAALFREFGDDGDDDTPRALVANLNLTPDAEGAAVETPTGQPVSTDTLEPAPTDTPAPLPTRSPEPTATDSPPPTQVQPTQTLEPAPTDTPVPFPTRTPEPIATDPPAE
ncbi:MAG TPA: protein kinase, partial [Thermomicrobiales bacterium]|nr:protein kinase [Thermomicrobiales bacterium]